MRISCFDSKARFGLEKANHDSSPSRDNSHFALMPLLERSTFKSYSFKAVI